MRRRCEYRYSIILSGLTTILDLPPLLCDYSVMYRISKHIAALPSVWSVIIAMLVSALICPACLTPSEKTPEKIKEGETDLPTVEIFNEEGRRVVYKVELARTDEERQKGLMGRTELSEDCGMLFIFPYESIQRFWMKDTPIPLDMIFITGKFKIAGIVKNTRAFDLKSHSVRASSKYVLEVNAGQASKWGLKRGDPFTFHGIDLKEP